MFESIAENTFQVKLYVKSIKTLAKSKGGRYNQNELHISRHVCLDMDWRTVFIRIQNGF